MYNTWAFTTLKFSSVENQNDKAYYYAFLCSECRLLRFFTIAMMICLQTEYLHSQQAELLCYSLFYLFILGLVL